MSWDPTRYRQFEEERNRPAGDLIHALGDGDFRRIADLGCGPGNSTEALRLRYPDAEILAVDSDPAMLAAARERLPGVRIEQADIARWQVPEGTDLLFSNAVFHWLPDHLPLLARLLAALAPGGALALQMPDNLDEPTHRLMAETALAGPWKSAFDGEDLPRRMPLPAPRDYVAALSDAGADVTLWRTAYYHRLPGPDAIVDFVAGAGLRPYADAILTRAGEAAHTAWRHHYRTAIAAAYPPLPDGSVLLAMPRLFILVRRR